MLRGSASLCLMSFALFSLNRSQSQVDQCHRSCSTLTGQGINARSDGICPRARSCGQIQARRIILPVKVHPSFVETNLLLDRSGKLVANRAKTPSRAVGSLVAKLADLGMGAANLGSQSLNASKLLDEQVQIAPADVMNGLHSRARNRYDWH